MGVLTIKEVLNRTTKYFSEKGIESARLDAEVLLASVLGVNRIDLYINFDRPLIPSELDAYRRVVADRGRRRPLAYILGEKEFMSLTFKVKEGVLIPRPETEILVEAISDYIKRNGLSQPVILDIGTGSGCIAIALAKEFPSAQVYATDISPEALRVARMNVESHDLVGRVICLEGDLFEPFSRSYKGLKFDVIVSNPPYIPSRQLKGLEPEVQCYEPFQALDGGETGLVYYERILKEAPGYLKAGGVIGLELGAGQAQIVQDMALSLGWIGNVEIIKDYSGIERVLILTKEGIVN